MSERNASRPTTGKLTTWLLIAVVVLLAALPLALNRGSEFAGADAAATKAIAEIAPNAKPWFEPLWSPPGSETQSLLFALQAGLGAGFIGYYFGLKRGERRRAKPGE